MFIVCVMHRLGDWGSDGGQPAAKPATSSSQPAAAAAAPVPAPDQEASGGQPSAAEKLLRALQVRGSQQGPKHTL